MTLTLSIIIPVYMTQATLDRCLLSVVGQTMADFEVILVDDGSPDGCPQMCDEWARRDARIKVIHQANGGLSHARNTGIEAAEADLITFVDSDDFLDPDTYRLTVPLAQNADIVEFALCRHYGSPLQTTVDPGNRTYSDMGQYWLQGRAYEHCYAWNKLYRRTLFRDVRFPPGRVFEDVATLPLLLQRAHRVVTTSQGVYYYCMNTQGITQNATGHHLAQLLESHLEAFRLWADDAYYMHILDIQMDVCRLTQSHPRLPLRHVSPLAQGLTSHQRMKALALALTGVGGICKLNKTLHRWRLSDHS